MSDKPSRVAVGITGASGALYAVRTLAALLAANVRVDLVVSDFGRRLLTDELGAEAAADRLAPYLTARYGVDVPAESLVVHRNRDMGAAIASGTSPCDATVIVPCSMKTLAGVAHGLSRNLIERAADVALKERRPSGDTRRTAQPRPMKGIFVAITVMNCTLASSGRLAM